MITIILQPLDPNVDRMKLHYVGYDVPELDEWTREIHQYKKQFSTRIMACLWQGDNPSQEEVSWLCL